MRKKGTSANEMTTLVLRLYNEDYKWIRVYAALQGTNMTEAMRRIIADLRSRTDLNALLKKS